MKFIRRIALLLFALLTLPLLAPAQTPQCSKGKLCGNTCIALDRVCRMQTPATTSPLSPSPSPSPPLSPSLSLSRSPSTAFLPMQVDGYDFCGLRINPGSYRSTITESPVDMSFERVVVADAGYIYQNRGLGADRIRRLKAREKLTVTQYWNGWYRVITAELENGWVECIFIR